MTVRRRTLISLVVALGFAVGAAGTAHAQDVSNCPDPPPPSQTSETINYTGAVQQVSIPDWASDVSVTAIGGWGQSTTNKTGPGGPGGNVTGTVDVDANPDLTCLDVWVGGYGSSHPAFGWGNGGGPGVNPFRGANGGGGGGATAIAPSDSTSAVIIAGGGGGGGGNGVGWQDRSEGTPGASGGAGAGGGSNGFGGMNGSQPDFGPNDRKYEGGVFGWADSGDGPNGQTGLSVALQIPGCPAVVGAGGGGGGGKTGGGAGMDQDPMVVVKHNPYCLNASYGFGAGGGAGGDSYASSEVSGAAAAPDSGPCPAGSGVPGCYGSVTINWSMDIGSFKAIGGAGQSATIGTAFAGPLQAQVVAVNGKPIPGLDVTFTAPGAGSSATFEGDSDSRTVTVTTDESGTATTPPLTANGTAGTYSVSASLDGQTDTTSFNLTNAPAATATAVWATPSNPSVAGEAVTFIAEVKSAPSTAPAAVGSVQFTVDGSPRGTPVPITLAGEAIAAPIQLEPGYHLVDAYFQPSPDFLPSQGEAKQEVSPGDTHIDLSSSENPSADGSAVTFTADVGASPPAFGTPTGTVTFTVDGTALGQPVELAGGQATSEPATIPAGAHTVEATYSGDSSFNGSDVDMQQSVGPDATATEISADPKVAVVGQAVTVTATVKPAASDTGDPTGAVSIAVDGIAACDSLTLENAEATCEITASPLPGPHSLTATYEPGSGDFEASSGSLTQTVIKSRSAVAVEADPDPSTFGQLTGFHAQIDPISPGEGTPTGSVSFVIDGTPFGDPVPLRDGRADSGALANLPAGPHAVIARYGGDDSFYRNRSGTTQVVDRAITVGTLTPSVRRAPEGTPVTFDLRLEAGSPATGVPGGTARLFVDGHARGPAVQVENGKASLGPVTFAAGSHQVRAQYRGNLNFSGIDTFLVETAERLVPPFGPDVTPGAPGRNPILCGRPIAIDNLRMGRSRFRITGTARDFLIGQQVKIRSRGRLVGKARVRADATFTVRIRAPRRKARRTASFVALAGGARSNSVRAIHRLRFTGSHRRGPRLVRLRARLSGGPVARVVLRRRGACGERARTVSPVKIRPRGKKRGRRTITVVVPRPAYSAGPAAYWLQARGKPLRSLPVLVMPQPRN